MYHIIVFIVYFHYLTLGFLIFILFFYFFLSIRPRHTGTEPGARSTFWTFTAFLTFFFLLSLLLFSGQCQANTVLLLLGKMTGDSRVAGDAHSRYRTWSQTSVFIFQRFQHIFHFTGFFILSHFSFKLPVSSLLVCLFMF